MEEASTQAVTPALANGLGSQSETNGKSDQPSEEKKLLDDGEANVMAQQTGTEEELD